MKLGIIRHFEVDARVDEEGMTTSDYLKWIDRYNKSPIIEKPVDMGGVEWNACYSSDMVRAYKTAEAIYDGDIISTYLLREVEVQPSIDTDEKKSYDFWKKSGRDAWILGDKSQIETREETRRRVNSFLDFIEHKEREDANVLIVSHIIIMEIIEEELKKRSYKGSYGEPPVNGKLYIFEK